MIPPILRKINRAVGHPFEIDGPSEKPLPHNFAAYQTVYINAVVEHHNAACEPNIMRAADLREFLRAFENCYPEMVAEVKTRL